MAINFQKNQSIEYKLNQSFLESAERFQPAMSFQEISPTKLVSYDSDAEGVNTGVSDYHIPIADISTIELKKGESIIIDFGQHCVGHFDVEIESKGSPMDAPLYLEVHFAEVASEFKETIDSYKGLLSSSWMQIEREHLDILPKHFFFSRRYSFRFVKLTVLDTSPKYQVSFKKPKATLATSASYENYKVFQTADTKIEKIDLISMVTLKNCMQSVFEDGPKRDQRLWLGDLRLQALVNYSLFQDLDIVKRCLYLFGGMPTKEGRIPANVFINPKAIPDNTFLFDYHLFFVSSLFDFFNFSKDQQVLKELYPVAKQVMAVADKQLRVNNLIDLDETWPVFIDWSKDIAKKTATNGIYLYVTKQFIQLANSLNDTEAVKQYENNVALVSKAVRDNFFDEDQYLFTSGDEKEINIASQVWMVLAGIFEQHENKKIMNQTIKKLFPIKNIYTPYMYHHVTEALYQSGLDKEAITLMKDYWGGMIDAGADTFWEAYSPDNPVYSPYQSMAINSYCHAWSCTPAYLLRKYKTGNE